MLDSAGGHGIHPSKTLHERTFRVVAAKANGSKLRGGSSSGLEQTVTASDHATAEVTGNERGRHDDDSS